MDGITPEGSLDSIPRPKYELIKSASGKSTPLNEDEDQDQEDDARFSEDVFDNFDDVGNVGNGDGEHHHDEDDEEEEDDDDDDGDAELTDSDDVMRAYNEMDEYALRHNGQSTVEDGHRTAMSDAREYHDGGRLLNHDEIKEEEIDSADDFEHLIAQQLQRDTDEHGHQENVENPAQDMVSEDESRDSEMGQENVGKNLNVGIILKKVPASSAREESHHATPPDEAQTDEQLSLATQRNAAPPPLTPIHIVGGISSPKIVQAKTKCNQVIMVKLLHDGDKELIMENVVVAPASQEVTANVAVNAANTPNAIAQACFPPMGTDPRENGVEEERRQQQQLLEQIQSADDEELAPMASQHPQPLQHQKQRSATPMCREFLALQRSVNESKVLTEFVNEGGDVKARSSRKAAVAAVAAVAQCNNSSRSAAERRGRPKGQRSKSNEPPAEPMGDLARCSTPLSKSLHFHSEHNRPKSSLGRELYVEGPLEKRTNMRSQNSDFVQKQMDFLNRLKSNEGDSVDTDSGANDELGRTEQNSDEEDGGGSLTHTDISYGNISMQSSLLTQGDYDDHSPTNISTVTDLERLVARLKAIYQPPSKEGWDSFCWKCHVSGVLIGCSKCIRSFHPTCLKAANLNRTDPNWICPECSTVENSMNKKGRRTELSVDLLNQLLSYALKRIKELRGCAILKLSFAKLMKLTDNYNYFIVNLVTFDTIERKIENKGFRCVEDFVNEAKWILHNIHIVSNVSSSKEISSAKEVIKACRTEANEIESCYECYLNSNTRLDWFVDVCSQPHLLVWAKLKGFPYWPAKAMGPGQGAHLVNVRFFGKHDRSSVPVKDCYLYSEQDPNPPTTGKRSVRELHDCIKEIEVHVEKIKAKIGDFRYAPVKTPYDPSDEMKQLESMIPGVREYIKRQQTVSSTKPSLQYKIVKNNNNLKFVRKASANGPAHDANGQSGPWLLAEASPSDEASANAVNEAATGEMPCTSRAASTNYEVISKIPDGEDPSKLSTVILKRKSLGSKSDEPSEHPTTAKVAKVDETPTSVSPPSGGKRKHTEGSEHDGCVGGAGGGEKHHHRSKHSKHEPRIPPFTIKTNAPKISSQLDGDEYACQPGISVCVWSPDEKRSKGKPKIPTVTIKTNGPKIVENTSPTSTASTASPATSTSPPNFAMPATTTTTVPTRSESTESAAVVDAVKNLQGITIKKISRNDAALVKNSSPDEVSLTARSNLLAHNENTTDNTHNNNNNNNDIAQSNCASVNVASNNNNIPPNQNSNNNNEQPNNGNVSKDPVVGLVPFIEIKREVGVPEKEAPTAPRTSSRLPLPGPMPVATPEMLVNIKQEVLSDEETTTDEATAAVPVAAEQVEQNSTSNIADCNGVGGNRLTEVAAAQNVRVGDTTIQKVSAKLPIEANASEVISQGPSGKRSFGRGIPYGPLPSDIVQNTNSLLMKSNNNGISCKTSTTIGGCSYPYTSSASSATSSTTNSKANSPEQYVEPQRQQQQQHQQQQQQNNVNTCITQRARKSFANRASPEQQQQRPPSASSSMPKKPKCLFDPSRSLLKPTSMVSIPLDVATQRVHVNDNLVAVSSTVPVPPLTAVSKNNSTAAVPLASLVSSTAAGIDHLFKSQLIMNNNTVPPPPLAGLSTSLAQPVPLQSASIAPINTMPAMPFPLPDTLIAPNTATSLPLPPLAPPVPVTSSTATLPAAIPSLSQIPNAGHATTPINQLVRDAVSPKLVSTMADMLCRGPPQLMPRPTGPLQSDGSSMFPSQAGPVSAKLVESAHKLTDFFISVMEETMRDMSTSETPSLEAQITLLKLEMERERQQHESQLADVKRNADLLVAELRKSAEKEKNRTINEVRKQCELERMRSVDETKRKQWCAQCLREAQFYCCWNTSYCNYPCQQLHWTRHSKDCAQAKSAESAKKKAMQQQRTDATNHNADCSTTSRFTTNNNNTSPNAVANSHKSKRDKTQQQQQHQQQQQQQSGQQPNIVMPAPMPMPSNEQLPKTPPNTYYRISNNNNGISNRPVNYFVNGRLNNNVPQYPQQQQSTATATAHAQVSRAPANWDNMNVSMRGTPPGIATLSAQQQHQQQQQQLQQQQLQQQQLQHQQQYHHEQYQKQQQKLARNARNRANAMQASSMTKMRNQKM